MPSRSAASRRVAADAALFRLFHAALATIDAALDDGTPALAVARAHNLGPDAVERHRRNHLGRRIAGTSAGGAPLDELVDALRDRALLGDPAVVREYRLALAAQDAARATAAPPVDLASTPEWAALRTAILEALAPYPEARVAVAEAIA